MTDLSKSVAFLAVYTALLIGAASLSIASPAALAGQDHLSSQRGWYLGAGYAMVYAPDEVLDVASFGATDGATDGTPTSKMFVDFDLGFRAASLAAGYGFKNGLRAELAGGYRRNELEVIEYSDARGVLNTGAKDAVDAFTGFANLYYDFKPALPIQPYLGVGAGVASVGYKGNFSVLEQFERREIPLFDERDSAFAWQLIAGASIAFTPRTRLAAEYRYWQTSTLDFSSDQALPQSSYRTRHKLHMAGIQLQYFPATRLAKGTRSRATTAATPSETNSAGWYGSVHIGAVAAEDSDVDDQSLDTNFDAFDLGPGGGIAVGYEWRSKRGTPLRAELEAQAFHNDADLVDFSFLAGEFRLRGDARTKALAINVIAERARRTGLRPYAGIGLGYAEVDYDVELRQPRDGFPDQQFLNGSATSPMAQALLGLRVIMSPRLSMRLGYRYWWAPLLKLRNPRGERIETEHSAHMIQLGLQWRLKAP